MFNREHVVTAVAMAQASNAILSHPKVHPQHRNSLTIRDRCFHGRNLQTCAFPTHAKDIPPPSATGSPSADLLHSSAKMPRSGGLDQHNLIYLGTSILQT